MSVSAPKAVVFDIGNVLVDWQPSRLYARLVPDEAARAALFARVDFHAMNLAGDRNGDLAAEVEALAARHPDDAPLIRAWRSEWREMFGPEMPGVPDLMRRLKAAGVRLAALTNFAADTWEEGREMFPILKEFDVEVVSGREGVVKPEAAIYELVEQRTGLSGDDLFFTDDKAVNVEAAVARGWRGHVFAGAEGLEAALGREGLPG